MITLAVLHDCTMGHAALIMPPSRNAADRMMPAFANGRSPATACTCANGIGGSSENVSAHGCDQGVRAGGGGQPCLWWSQGCSIGCGVCATMTAGTTPIHGNPPHADKIGFNKRYCDPTTPNGTSTLPRVAWTMNVQQEEENGVNDTYRFNPWRRPGSAPVVDPCGQAGGKFAYTPVGGDSVFTNTTLAGMGMMGSSLPAAPSGAVWTAGGTAAVSWGIRYNHGGGYAYRLCKADDPLGLTEECFTQTHLDFDRSAQTLVWNNGTRLGIPGVFVDEGTYPPRSTWSRNPIPRVNDDNVGIGSWANQQGCPGPAGRSPPAAGYDPTCLQFEPPCPQDDGHHPFAWSTDGSGQGPCSGDWTAGVIEDRVVVPAHLDAGEYVLSWRWDAEETAQIWLNCADVTIEAAAPTAAREAPAPPAQCTPSGQECLICTNCPSCCSGTCSLNGICV